MYASILPLPGESYEGFGSMLILDGIQANDNQAYSSEQQWSDFLVGTTSTVSTHSCGGFVFA